MLGAVWGLRPGPFKDSRIEKGNTPKQLPRSWSLDCLEVLQGGFHLPKGPGPDPGQKGQETRNNPLGSWPAGKACQKRIGSTPPPRLPPFTSVYPVRPERRDSLKFPGPCAHQGTGKQQGSGFPLGTTWRSFRTRISWDQVAGTPIDSPAWPHKNGMRILAKAHGKD